MREIKFRWGSAVLGRRGRVDPATKERVFDGRIETVWVSPERERCPEIKNIKKKSEINPKGNRKEKGFIVFPAVLFYFYFFSRCPTETAKVHDDSPSQSLRLWLKKLPIKIL